MVHACGYVEIGEKPYYLIDNCDTLSLSLSLSLSLNCPPPLFAYTDAFLLWPFKILAVQRTWFVNLLKESYARRYIRNKRVLQLKEMYHKRCIVYHVNWGILVNWFFVIWAKHSLLRFKVYIHPHESFRNEPMNHGMIRTPHKSPQCQVGTGYCQISMVAICRGFLIFMLYVGGVRTRTQISLYLLWAAIWWTNFSTVEKIRESMTHLRCGKIR